MADPIIFDIGSLVTGILVFVVTGILTWMTRQMGQLKNSIQDRNKEEYEQRRKHDEAVDAGLRSVLRSSITDAYERYVQRGEPLSIERKRVIEMEHEAYNDLGGNDVGDQMYAEIVAVSAVIIDKDILRERRG